MYYEWDLCLYKKWQIISKGRYIEILCGTVEKESTNAYSKHLLLIWHPWAQKKSNKGRRTRGKRDIIKYSLRNLMGWLSVNLNYIEWDSHATTASPSINPIFSKFDMHTSCVYKLKIVKMLQIDYHEIRWIYTFDIHLNGFVTTFDQAVWILRICVIII